MLNQKTYPALPPIDQLSLMEVGQHLDTFFGQAKAQVFCIEKLSLPTPILKFRVMVMGCDVGEVMAEQTSVGKWQMGVKL